MILFFPKSLQHNNLHSPDNFRYMPILFAPLFRNLYNKSCRFEKMYSFHDRFPRGDTPPARSSLFHNIKRYGGCQYILEMFRAVTISFAKRKKGKNRHGLQNSDRMKLRHTIPKGESKPMSSVLKHTEDYTIKRGSNQEQRT